MPPKTRMTAEEVQAEIDNDPTKLIRNDLSVRRNESKNAGVNRDIALVTEGPKGLHTEPDDLRGHEHGPV